MGWVQRINGNAEPVVEKAFKPLESRQAASIVTAQSKVLRRSVAELVICGAPAAYIDLIKEHGGEPIV